jgi:hypothetical protein
MIMAKASVVCQEYVMETNKAVAMDTESPGMAPMNKPATDPASTKATNRKLRKNPSISINSFMKQIS